MGGKTAQTSSQVQIPPEVLARYNSVNYSAEQAAQQPFQQYSSDPNAFVAPINYQQQAGINAVNDTANSYIPYFNAANANINGATNAGVTGTNAAYAPLSQGLNAANNLQGQATGLTTQAYGNAQPYNQLAAGLAGAGAGAVNPNAIDNQIGRYLNPYLNTVLGGTLAPMIQQQQQQQSGLMGNQILSHTFGGDRAGISQAVLAGQQNLALGAAAAGILQPAYDTALQTAQQQQGVDLSAAQANRAALQQASGQFAGIGQQVYGQGTGTAGQLANIGQQYFGQGATTSGQQAALAQQLFEQGATAAQIQAALGTSAQQAGLSGAQAQIGAGTLQQQTQQAGLSALYNQFQQQQGYPFQVAQFLANIAEGTGALSGSTTTSTQPVMSFFSDDRLKEDVEPIGKTFEGQNIIKFRYKGDPTKHIGLSAQETEKYHPEAVGLAGGYKTVNYDEATKDAAAKARAEGGAVNDNAAFEGFAMGGVPTWDLGSILQAQQGMYAPIAKGPSGFAIPNTASTAKLQTVNAPTLKPMDVGKTIEGGIDLYNKGKALWEKKAPPSPNGSPPPASAPPADKTAAEVNAITDPSVSPDIPGDGGAGLDTNWLDPSSFDFARGGLVPHKAGGGDVGQSYPLADTYASYLAQQKMHPFTDAGLYGNPLISGGVGGPYSTMLEGPNNALHILSADAPKPHRYEATDPSHASYEALGKALSAMRAKKKADGGYVPEPENEKTPGLAVAQAPAAPKDQRPQELMQMAQLAAMFANRGGAAKAAGGSVSMNMPYSASGTGYVPEQTEPIHELMQPQQSGGSGGGGGGLMDLAKMGLGIAALFNRGGRAGYADGGGPSEETSVAGDDPAPWLKHLFNLPTRTGTADIDPEDLKNSTGEPKVLPGAGLDIPEGALAGSRGTPHVIGGRQHMPSGLSVPRPTPRPDLATDNPEQVTSFREPQANIGDVSAATPTLPERGLGERVGDTISDTYHSLGLGGPKGSPPGATPTKGEDSDFMSRNQSWLVPLLKGVGAATLYPGKSLVGSLAYGAQQGAESYADIQNQMAERELTGAETQATKTGVFQQLQGNAPPGFMVVPGNGPNAFKGPDGQTYHYASKADYIGGTGDAAQQPQTSSQPPAEPVTVDYQKNLALVRPSKMAQDYLAKTFRGYVPGAGPVQNRTRVFAMNPGLEAVDKQDEVNAKNRIGDPGAVDQVHRQYVQLFDAINTLGQGELSGRGPDFDTRQALANAYKYGATLLGYQVDPSVENNLVAGDIINKIRQMTGTALADQSGQHSHEIAQALQAVLPGGEHQLKSANEILSQMMLYNQQQRDFAQYYNQYVGQNGMSAGVNDVFKQEMAKRYNEEQAAVSKLFQKVNGKSLYDVIRNDPSQVQKIENGYTDRLGRWHQGLGAGITRWVM